MKQTSPFRRLQEEPKFPGWKAPKIGFFQALLGILIWAVLFLLFLFFAYVQLFVQQTVYLLQQAKPGNYLMPYWLALVLVIFFFPVTLFIVILGGLIRLIQSR